MNVDTQPQVVVEFAKSFQALVNVVSPSTNGRLLEQTEEMKAAAEVSTHRLLEAARSVEHYFATKYVLFSTFFPEEILKEDITEMKAEIERKEALIAKYREKLPQWQQNLTLNITSSLPQLDNTKM